MNNRFNIEVVKYCSGDVLEEPLMGNVIDIYYLRCAFNYNSIIKKDITRELDNIVYGIRIKVEYV
jgi:hypothetical protein